MGKLHSLHWRVARSGVIGVVAGLVLIQAAAGWAQSPTGAGSSDSRLAQAQVSILDRRIKLALGAQSVASAVVEISKIARVQLIMRDGSLQGYAMPGLRGEFTLRDALTRALEGTGYGFHEANASTIGIDPPTASGAPAPAEAGGVAGAVIMDAGAPDVIPVSAIAAESESRETPSTAQEQPGAQRLDDVVVTATKRAKASRDIPVSITALRGEDLEKQGARDIKDYLMQAPGITMDEGEYGAAGGRRMTIRGIGPPQGGIGNQTVGQFIGDVPLTDPYNNYGTPDLDPFDLKTVEILRGPQGTTFGASALNGAIRYVPNEPVLQEWSGRGFADHVNLSEGGADTSYGAAINVPIGESVAFRGSAVLQNAPGMYDNLQRHEDNADSFRKRSGRGAVRWELSERFSANLMYLEQQSRMHDILVGDNPDGRLENNGKPGPSSLEFGFSMSNADLRYRFDDWGTLVYQFTQQDKHLRGDVDVGIRALGSLGIQSLRGALSSDVSGNVHELRLVSPDGGRWDWIVGLFSRDYEAVVSNSFDTAVLKRVLTSKVNPLKAKEAAIYGELVRRFGSHWEVTLGARRYDTRIDGVFENYLLSAVRVQRTPILQQEHGINPKFSVAWKPDENLMAYLTVARGFQFGGINSPIILGAGSVQNPVTGTPIPLTYQSSVLWSRELGIRTDWLDRTLRLDAAVFDIQWTKAQLQQDSGGIYSAVYTANIGEVSSRGVESSFTWLTPLPGLSVNLLASYIRAVTASEYESAGTEIPEGTQLPASPRVQTSTTLAYNTYLGPWVTGASLSHAYWGPAFSDLRHSYDIYDFTTLGFKFNVARPDLPLRPALTLGIANLMDERGVVGRNFSASGGSGGVTTGAIGETWTYVRPRSISLRVTAEFD